MPLLRALVPMLALVIPLAGCVAAPAPAPPAPTPQISAPSPTPRPSASTGASDPTAPAPVIAHGRRDLPKVALTFDADMTPAALRKLDNGEVASYVNQEVIDQLRIRQVRATLFLVGLWMQRYPELTAELAADPLFEVGTHSWDHPAFVADCYGLPTLPGPAMAQLTPTQDLLDRLAGDRSTRLFRFPGACHDDAALAAIGPAGVTAIHFDVAGADGFQRDPGVIAANVLQGVQNGSIVVLHMHGGNLAPATGAALPAIVDGLRAQGYQLVTVGELLADLQG